MRARGNRAGAFARGSVGGALLAALVLAASPAGAQGLEPPPTIPPGLPGSSGPPPPGAPTGQANSDDESQDSGLGLEWVWLNADVGGAYVNMTSLNSSSFALQQSSSSGPAFGVGAGVRLLFFTIGVRARDLQLSAFNLWELNAEAAFHMRIWHIDPYFGLRGGYAFVGTLNSGSVQTVSGSSSSDVAVHGFDVGPMTGIDVYLAKIISLGAEVDVPFLFLQRPPVALPAGVTTATLMLNPQQQQLYQQSGSSAGFGVVGTAHLGIHF